MSMDELGGGGFSLRHLSPDTSKSLDEGGVSCFCCSVKCH